jgi:hypothetical protein
MNPTDCLQRPYFQINSDGKRPEGLPRKVEEDEENITRKTTAYIFLLMKNKAI